MNHELHRSFLWHLSYRLTGSTADAEDVVQETLLKSLEAPPSEDRPLRPWLATVASRLSIDRLRQRQSRPYVGPWLPGLVLTADEDEREGDSGAGRYDLRESATVAFLVALEVLTPEQRAVLVLRDVFDQSAREVAEAVGLSEDNVRQVHHRARVALEGYDKERCVPDRATMPRSRELLEQLLTALVTGDAALAAKVLRADVRSLSDGGGIYSAARVPVVGFERVYLLYRRLTELRPSSSLEFVRCNGLWALQMSFEQAATHEAPRAVLGVVPSSEGISLIYTQLMPAKLPRDLTLES